MGKFLRATLAEQTAGFIRDAIRREHWKVRLPATRRLMTELDVSPRTLREALKILTDEGWVSPGAGRTPYLIGDATMPSGTPSRTLRLGILIFGEVENQPAPAQALLSHLLMQARLDGHDAFLVPVPAGYDPHKTGYLKKLAERAKADAWLLHHAPLETIRWFSGQAVPVLAIGGRSSAGDFTK